MKILFVQKVKAYAGSENWFTSIIPALIDKGIECELVCVIHPDNLPKLTNFKNVLDERKIPYHFIISKKDLSLKLLKSLKRITNKGHFDLVHLNLIHAELWFSLLVSFFGLKTKLVSTIHGFDEGFQAEHGFNPNKVTNTKYIRILKFCEKRISSYYAVSQGLENLVTKGGIIPKNKMRVINYGFDYPKFKTNFSLPQFIDKSKKTILVPGRIVEYKGQEKIIDSIAKLIEKGLNFKIIFAGDLQGEYGNYLKQKISDLGYTNYIEFLGHVSNLDEYFLSSDVIVLPSKSEGFGLVLLEAFNYEKPVITFNVPAFNETIEHNTTGLITPCFNIDELANNINLLLTNQELANRITVNAKKRLLDYYCLSRMVDETIAFYEEVL